MVHPARRPLVWGKIKKEKQKGRFLKAGFFVLLLIVGANLFIRGPAVLKELNRPFDKLPDDKTRTVELDLSFRTNLLLFTYSEHWGLTDIAIASYEPDDGRFSVLLFNLELEKNKLLRRKAQKIFREKGVGGLQRFVGSSLGVTIDRYGAFAGEDLNFTPQQFLQIKRELERPTVFFKIFSTKQKLNNLVKINAATTDLWKLFWKTRSAKFEENDIIFLKVTGEESLQSEETTYQVSGLFLDRKIFDEGAALTIRNSSGKAGAGAVLERYLTNLGATVVAVESSEEIESRTLLVVRSSKPKVQGRLSSIISFDKKKVKEEVFSGDMLIILGEDALGELTLP
ncbi:MAG: hypothetical protein A2113_02405 [Candidatus Woykebacteria bacterium GWA1_44_8]|uniref:LytR/CpsA/Psr regulator C-terminal domain-containing protein n=1 Tax=Candidatus Woykebacteria bacterium GWA1_44_8 TaxID=1802591 RepID=A0A1G1W334_9BACT|nr:MAG: hypothetical protein A2113_02405 [Candidatus Woykebacteria bacterium GWA1_44_8]